MGALRVDVPLLPWLQDASRKTRSRVLMKRIDFVLYVIQQPASGLVKIGVTADIKGRLRDLEHATGQQLEVLGAYSIGDMETHCHELAAPHRTLGEWFDPAALDLIAPWLPR